MGSDSKVKILIMAGILALVAVGAVLFFLKPGTQSTTPPPTGPGQMAQRPGAPGMPPGGPAGAPSATPGPAAAPAPPAAMPGASPAPSAMPAPGAMPGMPAPAAAPGTAVATSTGLPIPGAPAIGAPPVINMAGIPDPMGGGPIKVRPPKPVYPRVVLISTLPPEWPARSVREVVKGPTGGDNTLAPIGRLAGWIYNSNGQLIAIFEDADGISRSVRVGDEVANMTVKALLPDRMVLVASNGKETTVKLQGLENYQGKSRSVNVNAVSTPTAPTWGAQ